jgi:PAS domain S-box-containing protein
MSARQANVTGKNALQRCREMEYVLDQFALTAQLHPSGLILNTNSRMLHVAGYAAHDMQDQPFSRFLTDEFRAFFMNHVLPLLNRGIPWRGELCHVARNGEQFWCETTIVPILNADRSLQESHYIGLDVTERKAVEQSLANNSVFFSKLMDIAPIGFFLADVEGSCTYINSIWSQTSGCRLRQALGWRWLRAVHPEDRDWVEAAWLRFVKHEESFNHEYRYQHGCGRTVWVLATAERMEFAPLMRPRFIRVEKDLTERKESEQLINEQRAKMEATARMSALGEMAGGIAHEINNPLAILQLRARQIMQLVKSQAPFAMQLRQAGESIQQTTDRIATIIQSLRMIAREGHGDPFEPTPVQTLLNHVLELCSARFQSHSIQLRIEPFSPGLLVWCRPVEVLQLLLNLLNNAFSAVKILPEKWVNISVHDRAGDLEIWITDSGPGIVPELQPKIFQPFFTTKPIGSGTGLGLSISKAVALDHHGDLWIDPDCPHTRFILRLPQYPSLSEANHERH